MQNRIQNYLMPLAMAFTMAALSGCYHGRDRTAGRMIDDRMVNNKVEGALRDATVYKFDDVRVSTHNGIVQLSGWATTEEQQSKAAEIASRVEGVTQVINNISLKLTPTGRGAGYPERSDTNNVPARTDAPIKTYPQENENRNGAAPIVRPNSTTTNPDGTTTAPRTVPPDR